MIQGHHIDSTQHAASVTTFAATGSAVLFWGLHVSDVAVIMSAFASVCSVLLQCYLAVHRIRRLERASDASKVVTSAVAESVRALDKKVETKDNEQTP